MAKKRCYKFRSEAEAAVRRDGYTDLDQSSGRNPVMRLFRNPATGKIARVADTGNGWLVTREMTTP